MGTFTNNGIDFFNVGKKHSPFKKKAPDSPEDDKKAFIEKFKSLKADIKQWNQEVINYFLQSDEDKEPPIFSSFLNSLLECLEFFNFIPIISKIDEPISIGKKFFVLIAKEVSKNYSTTEPKSPAEFLDDLNDMFDNITASNIYDGFNDNDKPKLINYLLKIDKISYKKALVISLIRNFSKDEYWENYGTSPLGSDAGFIYLKYKHIYPGKYRTGYVVYENWFLDEKPFIDDINYPNVCIEILKKYFGESTSILDLPLEIWVELETSHPTSSTDDFLGIHYKKSFFKAKHKVGHIYNNIKNDNDFKLFDTAIKNNKISIPKIKDLTVD